MYEHVIRRATWCEHEYRRCPDGCPIEVAENRLREVHRHWHSCASSYLSPDDFRDSLNSAIQALRNVTFALQSSKSAIPGFDEWYAGEQKKMSADPVLRWSLKARNTIVKAGDLNTMSRLRFTLVPNYEAESDAVGRESMTWSDLPNAHPASVVSKTVETPVGLSIDEVFAEIDSLDLPRSVRQGSSVLFEREWVDDKMPNFELLTLVAYAYGRLNTLLTRAHELLDMQSVRLTMGYSQDPQTELEVETLDVLPLEGRLPCMASLRHFRVDRFRLSDGSEVTEFLSQHAKYDPEIVSRLRESGIYGKPPEFPRAAVGLMQSAAQLAELVAFYGTVATGILKSGQDHGWFSHYYRRGFSVGSRVHATIDTQGKHAIAAQIGQIALELDADAVVVIGEVWMSPLQLTPDGAHVPPSLHSERTEGLTINAVAKSGARAGGLLPCRVLSGEPPSRVVEIDDYVPQDGTSGLLLPTLAAWRAENEPLQGAAFWRAQKSTRNE